MDHCELMLTSTKTFRASITLMARSLMVLSLIRDLFPYSRIYIRELNGIKIDYESVSTEGYRCPFPFSWKAMTDKAITFIKGGIKYQRALGLQRVRQLARQIRAVYRPQVDVIPRSARAT